LYLAVLFAPAAVSEWPGKNYWSALGDEDNMDKKSPRINNAPISPEINMAEPPIISIVTLQSPFHDQPYTGSDARNRLTVALQ
jgi:hypothetical protein